MHASANVVLAGIN